MKQSQCGRIISQRKQQSTLLKQYNTRQAIQNGRINELKKKYIKTQVRTPLSLLQASQNILVSDFAEQARKRCTMIQQEYARIDQIKKMRKNDVNQFRLKAEQTNYNINSKLNDIQEQINRLKCMKTTQDIQARQLQTSQVLRMPDSIKISKVELIQIPAQSIQLFNANNKNLQIEQSTCKLLGQFNSQRQYSHQFTIFINRLKDQISLDFDFTQLLLSLPISDRQAIKQFVKVNYPSADIQFFVISPIELDPLQSETKSYKGADIQAMSKKLYEFYLKIQQHFKIKLLHKFEPNTVATLFEQIPQKQVTLGHLISYINMRTGRQFRNRALVKLLRRLGICSHIIDPIVFGLGFVRY